MAKEDKTYFKNWKEREKSLVMNIQSSLYWKFSLLHFDKSFTWIHFPPNLMKSLLLIYPFLQERKIERDFEDLNKNMYTLNN